MNAPKISVIIPIYNAENYLGKCLDSLLAQTLTDIEILCVNDGSTDNSLKIIKKYAGNDKRIKLINQKNQGQSAARNSAMKSAKGKYLAFVDADDYVNDCFFESLYNAAISNDADIALGNIIRVEEDKKDDYVLFYNKIKTAHKTDGIFKLLNIPKTCYVWNRIYKRDFILENNLFFKEGVTYEDIIWSTVVAAKAKNAVSVPQANYYYVYNANSTVATTDDDPKKNKDRHDAFLFYNKFIKEHKIKAPVVWEKVVKIKFFCFTLIKIKEIVDVKKAYYFCGIKFATSKIRKSF